MTEPGAGGTAVLLMALGGPDSIEAVGPYLLDLRGGRPTPPELVAEIRERYAATGGRSPVLEITRALAARLEAIRPVRAFVGLRHWHPTVAEAWAELVAAAPARVVAICMAPHNSAMTVGKYYEQLDEARARVGGSNLLVARVESWATHPGLIAGLAGAVAAGLAEFPAPERDTVPVLFTAHSLPERILATADPYPDEVAATVAAVAEQMELGADRIRFAFQSQGRSAEPWLGPTVEETLEALAADGHTGVLVAPIGFLSEHLEVNYDIDIEFAARAEKLGLRLARTPMLNATDPLVETLAALVDERLAALAGRAAGRGAS